MKFLQLIFFTVAAATTNSRGVQAQIELPRQDDLKVKRHLLEKQHPAFKTFKGDMFAGLIPAVLDSADSSSDDFSSYMFWMFQPDVDASAEVSSCSLHSAMLDAAPSHYSFTHTTHGIKHDRLFAAIHWSFGSMVDPDAQASQGSSRRTVQ